MDEVGPETWHVEAVPVRVPSPARLSHHGSVVVHIGVVLGLLPGWGGGNLSDQGAQLAPSNVSPHER